MIPLIRKIALGIILGIGLPSMILVGTLIWTLVIPSGIPGMRWQVFQSLQVAHALWPPFMIMGFYWSGRIRSKTWLENLIANLDVDAADQ